MPDKFVHLEKLNPKWTHYIARSFDIPVGDIEPKSKQPWKKYEGICVLSVRKKRAIIRALVSVPPRGLYIMRRVIAEKLDLLSLHGISWDEKTKTKRRINIPLRRTMKKDNNELDETTTAKIHRAIDRLFDDSQATGEPFSGNAVFIVRRNRRATERPIALFLRGARGRRLAPVVK